MKCASRRNRRAWCDRWIDSSGEPALARAAPNIDGLAREESGVASEPQSPADRHARLKAGTVLQARYRIQDVLGVGGMSTVYRARDLRFSGVERWCAVKEMFNERGDAKIRQMRVTNFQREAALLATLSHQAIPRIYDYFEHQGSVYLILELIHGRDLESLLVRRGKPFAEDTLLSWTTVLVDLLAFLHAQQPEPIIFRDLKPSNIMIRESDQSVVLVDFGIARTFTPNEKGTMIGTEGYAPPEQYRGIADARGDIYALGATLHHLATAIDPRTETPFTFAQRPPRRHNPALSPAFEQFILRCVAYSPTDRYESMLDARRALETIRSRADGPARAAHQRSPADGSSLLRMPATLGAKERQAQDRERLDWVVTTGDEVRGSPSHAGGAVYVGSYDQHLYAIDETDGSVRWRFRAQRGIVSRPLVAGELVIVGSEDHNVHAVTRQHGRLHWSFRTSMPVRSSGVCDERTLYIGSDDGFLYRIDRSRGTMLWRYRTWGPIRSTPALCDRLVVAGSDDGYVYAIDQESGQLRWRHEVGAAVMSSAVVAGNVLIFGASDGVVRAVHATTGELVWSHRTGKAVIASPTTVDRTAYIGSADGAVYALDLASGDVTWKQPVCRQVTATVTADGELLYVGGTDGQLYALNRDSGTVRWQFAAGGPIVSRPLTTAEHIIVGSLDGKVYGVHRGR